MTVVYNKFLEEGGAEAIPIRFDMPPEELYPLLDSINGVVMTGGALKLIQKDTGLRHRYYITAKRIYDYSKQKKDLYNEEFPILGVCQGI